MMYLTLFNWWLIHAFYQVRYVELNQVASPKWYESDVFFYLRGFLWRVLLCAFTHPYPSSCPWWLWLLVLLKWSLLMKPLSRFIREAPLSLLGPISVVSDKIHSSFLMFSISRPDHGSYRLGTVPLFLTGNCVSIYEDHCYSWRMWPKFLYANKEHGEFLLNFFTIKVLNLQTCVRYFMSGDTHPDGGEAWEREREITLL